MPVVKLLSDHCQNQHDMPTVRQFIDRCQHRPTAERNNSASAVYQICTDHMAHQTTIHELPRANDHRGYTLIEDFGSRNRSKLPAQIRIRTRSGTNMTKFKQSSPEDSSESDRKFALRADSGAKVRKLRSVLRQSTFHRPRYQTYVCQCVDELNRTLGQQKSQFLDNNRLSNMYRNGKESSTSWEEESNSEEDDELSHKPRFKQCVASGNRSTPCTDLRQVSSFDDVEFPNDGSDKMSLMELQKCNEVRERMGRERRRRQPQTSGEQELQDMFICCPKVCRQKIVRPNNCKKMRSERCRSCQLCCRSISPPTPSCEILGRDESNDGTKTTLYLCSEGSASPVSGSSGCACQASYRQASQDTNHPRAGENTFRLSHECKKRNVRSSCRSSSRKSSPCQCCIQAIPHQISSQDIVVSEECSVIPRWKNLGVILLKLLRLAIKWFAVFALTCAALFVIMAYACANYLGFFCVILVITLLLFILMTKPDSLLIYCLYKSVIKH